MNTKILEYYASLDINENDYQYGMLIEISDFMFAGTYVLSGLADFHNERMHTMFLYEEQRKPSKYD